MLITSASWMPQAAAADEIFIENGDFENGINGFGVCYSSRNDTVMPSIYENTLQASEGTGALELFPGASLSNQASTGTMSKGFAYQGIYHKKTFSAEKGINYVISTDVYPKGAAVKARLLVMDGSRAVAASQEFAVNAGAWTRIAFRWQPVEDSSNTRVRVAFYQITEGKSILVDNIKCEEAIIGNGIWKPKNNEVITLHENNVMRFETAADTDAGIYGESALSRYTDGTEYALTGTLSTTADTAYVSLACSSLPVCHSDYVLKNGEPIQVQLPFSVAGITGETVRFEVDARTTGGTVALTDFNVADVNSLIVTEQSGQALTISGQLRKGNESKTVGLAITDMGVQTVATDETGKYTCSVAVPAFEGARKKLSITLSELNGYAENNNQLSTDYFARNDAYFNDKAAAVAACTTAAEVKAVLTTDVLDDMGISAIPVVLAADTDAVFAHLAGAAIADGDGLVDEILTASAWNVLDRKEGLLCDILEEYGTLLDADSVAAYKDIYPGADKAALNEMFADSTAEISDEDSFVYALTEVLARYAINSKTTYAQQMEILQKYADDLNLDLSAYLALSSAQQYSVATTLTKNIDQITDYSVLQTKLDAAIQTATASQDQTPGNSTTSPGGGGGGFGGGGGGNIGIYKDELQSDAAADTENTASPEGYRFSDLSGYAWAEESIYRLVEEGVISQPADRQFHPGDNITRAEFAKMAAVLFDIQEHQSVSAFTDVQEGDWYHDYVMALFEEEIVFGISEDYFGSSEAISRQDICVILQRLLGDVPKGDESFTDMEDAADYAKDAIRVMKKLGIINGYEDGSFRPNAYATRAEVAKILCAIEL